MHLFVVSPPGHAPHSMILCECCEKETADYYASLRWPFSRVRKARAAEAQQHCCLD